MGRKIIAALVGVVLAILLFLVSMRLLTLAGFDVAWIRGSIWVFIGGGILFLGVILVLLLRPRQKPKNGRPPGTY